MQFTWQDPAHAIMGAVHCHSVRNPRSVYFLSLSYLGLGEEEENSAVGEATGDVLHAEDTKLLLLVGTSCCAEPSLEVFHISPALAGPACLAWAHQGWEVGLHSFHFHSTPSFGLIPRAFLSPSSPWALPPLPLLVCARPAGAGGLGVEGCGGCGEVGALQQPRGGGEPLSGAWWMQAEHLNQSSAFPPLSLLQTWVRLF